MLTKAQEQLQVANLQSDSTVKEIGRAQPAIHALDEEREEAGGSARRARERVQELLSEIVIQDAK